MRIIDTLARPLDGTGHFGPITSVEWSPDGSMLATGSYDGHAIIWSGNTLQPKCRFQHPRLVNSVRWSRCSKFISVASADGHCYIWDATQREQPAGPIAVLSRHTDDVNTMAWAAANEFLTTVSEDGTGRIWMRPNYALHDTILVHSDHCMSVDCHPTKQLIATCGEDASIKIWDSSGNLIANWSQPGDLETVRWSPNGETLAAACDDGTIRVLSDKGQEVAVLGPHDAAVKSVAWSPDSKMIAAGSYDLSVAIWNVSEATRIARIQGPRLWPRSASWSPDGTRIAVGSQDGTPAVLRIQPDASRKSASLTLIRSGGIPTYGVNSLASTPQGWLAGLDDGTVKLWDHLSGSSVTLRPEDSGGKSLVNACAFSHDLNRAAIGRFSGEIWVFSLDLTSSCTASINAPVNSVAWMPNGKVLAVADYDGVVTLFVLEQAANGEALRFESCIRAHAGAIKGIAWLDADRIVTASTDRTLGIVSISGDVSRSLVGHGNLINAVAVTSNDKGSFIASASRDRTVRIWNADTGVCERVLVGHTESVKSVAWKSGSVSELVSGSYDFDARYWNLDRNVGHKGYTHTLAYHKQGVASVLYENGFIATASWDGMIALWGQDSRGSFERKHVTSESQSHP
jgi:WD40 repeat protein